MTDEPTRSMSVPTDDSKPDPLIGTTVGDRYRILGQIGEGAFGVVYEAEQKSPVTRRVAIKVIKPGMDSKAVVARFKAEEQALAVMNHPGIAKVLDAGETDRGLPFFAMELVKGEPVTDFCDRNTLSIDQRLELMIEIAHAVQHAHTKGVIHRDLKPSNILVGYDDEGKPRPKVIDFGVAKALNQRLTEQTVFTDRGQFIGTPEYMSPEQAEMSGVDIDTRADVYSLGVLLYELLTGVRPFDLRLAAFHEIQRVIRETEPHKPSTRLSTMLTKPSETEAASRIIKTRRTDTRSLASILKRDLDWVVMKALDKDRERRYDTASSLAEDIRRYLNGEMIEAGPPSLQCRLLKIINRNKLAATIVAGFISIVILAAFGMSIALMEARAQRGIADRAAADAMVAREAEVALRLDAERKLGFSIAAQHAMRAIENYKYVDDQEQYFQVIRHAADLAKDSGDSERYLDAMDFLAQTYASMARDNETSSTVYYERANETYISMTNYINSHRHTMRGWSSWIGIFRAQVLQELGDGVKATELVRDSINNAQRIHFSATQYMICHSIAGEIYSKNNFLEEAIYHTSLALETGLSETYVYDRFTIASMRRAIDVCARLNRKEGTQSDVELIDMLVSIIEAHESLPTDKVSNALELLERFKARSISGSSH